MTTAKICIRGLAIPNLSLETGPVEAAGSKPWLDLVGVNGVRPMSGLEAFLPVKRSIRPYFNIIESSQRCGLKGLALT